MPIVVVNGALAQQARTHLANAWFLSFTVQLSRISLCMRHVGFLNLSPDREIDFIFPCHSVRKKIENTTHEQKGGVPTNTLSLNKCTEAG